MKRLPLQLKTRSVSHPSLRKQFGLKQYGHGPGRRGTIGQPVVRKTTSPTAMAAKDVQGLRKETHTGISTRKKAGQADNQSVEGQVALASVALLWGSYSPALRGLYSMDNPPTPVALTAARAFIQAVVLYATASAFSKDSASRSLTLSDQEEKRAEKQAAAEEREGGQEKQRRSLGMLYPPVWRSVHRMMASTTDSSWVAGLEMGFWNFLATSSQALGLEHTTATRGAFLIQATALLTPVLATLAGESLGSRLWRGCLIALVGSVLISLDHPASSSGSGASFIVGDGFVLASAAFYSMATVRLGVHARRLPSVQLAAYKSVTLAAISLLWLLSAVSTLSLEGQSLLSLWPGYHNLPAWILLTYSAIGPGALAAVLQTFGQSHVPSAQAQVIYSTTPLWSALFAGLLIPGESLGWLGWSGGLTIVAAGFYARSP
eukprot:jgi/Botrbrau1/12491/Bobra.0169s0038.1